MALTDILGMRMSWDRWFLCNVTAEMHIPLEGRKQRFFMAHLVEPGFLAKAGVVHQQQKTFIQIF